MSSRADLSSDLDQLKLDAKQMAEDNARLRSSNTKMIATLRYVLPLIQQGLPSTVDFDQIQEALAKIQDALAQAQSDP